MNEPVGILLSPRGRIACMRFRKLRIAWSVACGIACVLLVVLWVRSRGTIDTVAAGYWPGRRVLVESHLGKVYVGFYSGPVTLYRLSNQIRPSNYFPSLKTATFVVPLWIFIVATALAGTAPWLRKRYSLRTLLIATTLIAVVLGLVVWANGH